MSQTKLRIFTAAAICLGVAFAMGIAAWIADSQTILGIGSLCLLVGYLLTMIAEKVQDLE